MPKNKQNGTIDYTTQEKRQELYAAINSSDTAGPWRTNGPIHQLLVYIDELEEDLKLYKEALEALA